MSIQSITVPAGTPIYIPSNATILAVTSSVDGIATSSCKDIPDTPTVCYSFLWQINADDFSDAIFEKIIIGNLEWSIPTDNSYVSGGLQLATALNSIVNKIWTATYIFNDGDDKGVVISMPDMGVVPQLKINQGVGTVTTYLLLQGNTSTCDSPDGWTAL
jgi:hypothetical protein